MLLASYVTFFFYSIIFHDMVIFFSLYVSVSFFGCHLTCVGETHDDDDNDDDGNDDEDKDDNDS